MDLWEVLVATATVIGGLVFFRDKMNASGSEPSLDELFREIGNQKRFPKVNPALLKAIAKRESSLDPTAIRREDHPSGASSFGLMQILCPQNLPALSEYGVKWPPENCDRLREDIRYNIEVGAAILDWNIQDMGSIAGGVAKYNDSDPHSETPNSPNYDNQPYVDDVMKFYRQYRESLEG